jgi:hypothetical protein
MKKEIAVSLMKNLLMCDSPLNEASALIEQISDEVERKQFRRGIAEVIARIYSDLMIPIERQFPELGPDHSNETPEKSV